MDATEFMDCPEKVTPERIAMELSAIDALEKKKLVACAQAWREQLHENVLEAIGKGLISGDAAKLCAQEVSTASTPDPRFRLLQ